MTNPRTIADIIDTYVLDNTEAVPEQVICTLQSIIAQCEALIVQVQDDPSFTDES